VGIDQARRAHARADQTRPIYVARPDRLLHEVGGGGQDIFGGLVQRVFQRPDAQRSREQVRHRHVDAAHVDMHADRVARFRLQPQGGARAARAARAIHFFETVFGHDTGSQQLPDQVRDGGGR